MIGGGGCTVKSKLNKIEHAGGEIQLLQLRIYLQAEHGPRAGISPVNRMNDTQTRLKTLPLRNFVGGGKNTVRLASQF